MPNVYIKCRCEIPPKDNAPAGWWCECAKPISAIDRLAEVEARNKKLEHVKDWAQIVADGMKDTVGGDWYQFNGSMNDVDGLREALEALRTY